MEVKLTLTEAEAQVLFDVLLVLRHNGNSVSPHAFVPAPAEYNAACHVMRKLDEAAKANRRMPYSYKRI